MTSRRSPRRYDPIRVNSQPLRVRTDPTDRRLRISHTAIGRHPVATGDALIGYDRDHPPRSQMPTLTLELLRAAALPPPAEKEDDRR